MALKQDIQDLRLIAETNGLNLNLWSDFKKVLKLKPKLYLVVGSVALKGGETNNTSAKVKAKGKAGALKKFNKYYEAAGLEVIDSLVIELSPDEWVLCNTKREIN